MHVVEVHLVFYLFLDIDFTSDNGGVNILLLYAYRTETIVTIILKVQVLRTRV